MALFKLRKYFVGGFNFFIEEGRVMQHTIRTARIPRALHQTEYSPY